MAMIDLSATDALDLPVDELGLLVLADLVRGDAWSEHNYTNSYRNDHAGLGYRDNTDAQQAIAEAVGWLRAQGMIARTPAHSDSAAIFVTRWGRQALEK